MTKHTPAPWSVSGSYEIRSQSSLILATVYEHLRTNQSDEERKANAILIASAPELLEVLEKLIRYLGEEWASKTTVTHAYYFEGLKAIAKAKGETPNV
jgi:hypothetical protein